MIKFVQFILFLTGLAGVFCIGWLLNMVEPGTGIAFWLVLALFMVIFFRKYPKEELAVFFGFYFGLFFFIGICGGYYILRAGHEVLAVFWILTWAVFVTLIQRKLAWWLTPTLQLVEEFAKIVGPIPVHRELPKGCGLTFWLCLLFLILLMTAELLGPILWLVHAGLLYLYLKRGKGREFSLGRLLLFVSANIFILFVLYHVLHNTGAEALLRQLLGG